MIGIRLGNRYELLEKIGEGGMAEVYRAKCHKLNRSVAVKILKKQFANNKDISDKFKREATAVANLSDANIVNILDVGTENNTDYIVMEYVNGKTLKEFINQRGKLNYDLAIKIGIQIANALDCAHKNNIIHRDIKPHNILITELLNVKVTDFGIAKSTDSDTMTHTNSIVGSAHYLSPEQARGTYVDFRTDIYSFGIVLYEMVTGRLPFEGEQPVTVALKHIQEEPLPPKNINSAIPHSLNTLILKAIQKEPIKRYQNANEIMQDLQKVLENPDIVLGAVIDNSQNTMIMNQVTEDIQNTQVLSSVPLDKKQPKDNYYEEEDEEDDDDYDDYKKDRRKNKKGKFLKNFLLFIGGIIILFGLGSMSYFLAGSHIKNASANKTSTSDEKIKVPDVIGSDFEEAKSKLEELGLQIQVTESKKSDKPKNIILEVAPKVGENINKGESIKVILSNGESEVTLVTVPDLRDYSLENAKDILSDKGLRIAKRYEFSSSVEKGNIIKQEPLANTDVDKDSTVQIVISNGPEVKEINIPNVVGKSLNHAKSAIESAGLKVGSIKTVDSDEENDEKVTLQSKIGTAKENEVIDLTVGKYTSKSQTQSSNNDSNKTQSNSDKKSTTDDKKNEETNKTQDKHSTSSTTKVNVASLGISKGQTLGDVITKLVSNGYHYTINGSSSDPNSIVTDFTPEVEPRGTVDITIK